MAIDIYDSLGCYLGHTLPYYARFYSYKHLQLLGRVTSGKGGEIMINRCKQVIAEEIPRTER